MKTSTLLFLVRTGQTDLAVAALKEKVASEYRAAIREEVEGAFLRGPLEWINHPEYVVYSWVTTRKDTVQATAEYKGQKYVLSGIKIPRHSRF